MTLEIDPGLFSPSAQSEETRAFNAQLVELLEAAPDMWSQPPEVVRQNRLEGRGPFPPGPVEPTARMLSIETVHGSLDLRVFTPKNGESQGTYLHIHGGGWMIGSALAQDLRLQEIADHCALSCLSVEYRLAPEHPYPSGLDDCEAAALWLLKGEHEFNLSFLAIGGESAGAHLAALTLIQLRDRLGHCPFHAANLESGVYDLGLSPSARNWGALKLILNTRDMEMFVKSYLQNGEDRRSSDISPLYADLDGLPTALFSVGTRDPLLDDSVLMATRWHAANGNAVLDVTPGGCHVFQNFRDLAIAQTSVERIDRFLIEARENRA